MFRFIPIVLLLCFINAQIDTIVTVNASSYTDWVYFSFNQGGTIIVDEPETSLDWDLAFQRNNIKTNSGLSGYGNGGGYVDLNQTWTGELFDSYDTITSNIQFESDNIVEGSMIDYTGCYDFSIHVFVDCAKNPSLDKWGWFDDSYTFNINNYMMLTKTANGNDYYKFWPFSYYTLNGSGGYITFRYASLDSSLNECNYMDGDVNYDNFLNVVDLVSIVNFIISDSNYDDCQESLADFNQDGIINVVDLVGIINLILN